MEKILLCNFEVCIDTAGEAKNLGTLVMVVVLFIKGTIDFS